ncbi:MAG: C45 family peptidase [Planctomycetota bacterium]|nr:C45 family peptidase [Planctomycetota bacterium]
MGWDEFAGIARGADLTLEQCYVLQGLTDLQDVLAFGPRAELEGCSHFIVAPNRSATGRLLLGQNWDLKTDNMPFVRLVARKPQDAPATASLTLTGCLTLIGVNAAGVAVGNTNLKGNDARPGVQYLTVLHRALRSESFEEAAEAVRGSPRAGAHYYYVGGPNGEAAGFECSATRCAEVPVASGTYTHCNHYLDEELKPFDPEPPSASTCRRQARLSELMAQHAGKIGIDDLKRFLSDHDGGADLALCRHHGPDQVSTNACVILSPQTREIHACRGQPHVGTWITRKA